ncbi:MAG: hypothetical protein LC676_12175 [Loktanella sp.]|nr:hypothetical protein [Loktanella sp.]
MTFQINLGAGLVALSSLAACNVPAPAPEGPLAERLAGSRLTLRENASNANPDDVLILELAQSGRGVMTVDPMILTFDWSVPRDDQFCIENLRLGGILSDDDTLDCAQVQISGNTITLDWPEDSPDGRRSARGTISPL